jgi:hypothetical protein
VSFAICSPVVIGRLNSTWFDAWVAWHRKLGVQHLFFYTAGKPSDMHPVGVSYDWIDVGGWLRDFTTWSRAQLWSMHDCLFRARAHRVSWLLFLDVDELLRLPPGDTLPQLAARLVSDGKTGASFGSVPYLNTVCRPNAARGSTLAELAAYRALQAECQPWDDHPPAPPAVCPGWQGRRKYMLHTLATHKLHIHHADVTPERYIDLSTEDGYWLKHVRGAPWNSGMSCGVHSCVPQLNGTLLCPRNATQCGSECDPATANPAVLRTDLLYSLEG